MEQNSKINLDAKKIRRKNEAISVLTDMDLDTGGTLKTCKARLEEHKKKTDALYEENGWCKRLSTAK